jgi:hypothetical protein
MLNSRLPGRNSTRSSTFGNHGRVLSIGAGEGIRTLDPNLGKVVLYP